jgi:hypothetical protein
LGSAEMPAAIVEGPDVVVKLVLPHAFMVSRVTARISLWRRSDIAFGEDYGAALKDYTSFSKSSIGRRMDLVTDRTET